MKRVHDLTTVGGAVSHFFSPPLQLARIVFFLRCPAGVTVVMCLMSPQECEPSRRAIYLYGGRRSREEGTDFEKGNGVVCNPLADTCHLTTLP